MAGPHDSGDAPRPRGRGRCCACCKICHFHSAVVFIIFILIFLGCGAFNLSSQITLESLCYVAIACLYAFTPSSRKERTLSGVFLSLLAAVIVLYAANYKRSSATVAFMSVCNLLALAVYCIWKLRSRGCCTEAPAAADADAEVPLAPVQAEEAVCPVQVQVQQTTIHIEQLPRKFTFNEIRAVTGDFGAMVGRGGSGQVFRGLLDDGRAVAVKRITSDRPVIGEADFLREISIVASVHHRSLVRLLGYCVVRGGGGGGQSQYYLVYPFFENGSLDWWLFHGENRRRLLPWPTRRRVAVDVARALAYLHHECHRQILHLDVKPANVLLDGRLRAHVSDFGISVSVAQDLTSVHTRGRGTVGYMAPEMLVGSLSGKSDVYSYGVMLLELVAGRRSVEHGSAGAGTGAGAASSDSETADDLLASVVRDRMVRGELTEVVDTAMARVDEREVEEVLKVALCCVQHSRDVRPSMLTVLDMIEGRVAVDLPLEIRQSVSVVDFVEVEPLPSIGRQPRAVGDNQP